MFLARKRYKNRLEFLADQQASIIKIQSAWRGKKTRDDYQSLSEYTPRSHSNRALTVIAINPCDCDYYNRALAGLDYSEVVFHSVCDGFKDDKRS